MENLGQGLALSLTGLLITFAALGALILLIVALEWVFRPRPRAAAHESTPLKATSAEVAADDLDEVAAAIAVAFSQLQSEGRPHGDLGEALRRGPGPWWHRGELAEVIGGPAR